MLKIAVIGESCIDEYVYGTCDRVCPEAAALCFSHTNKKTINPGMAGNTYQNLKSLNQDNIFEIDLISSKSSIIKRRFVDQKYNSIIFREDIDDRCDRIDVSNYFFGNYDCIVISDYNKGFLTINDIQYIHQNKKSNCLIFIDTKKSLKDIAPYVDFIKINTPEFIQNQKDITSIINHTNLIVTEGERAQHYIVKIIQSILTQKK